MSLINKIVKHYKGQHYRVPNIALHTETKEQMVVYEQLYETDKYPYGFVWTRPLNMFEEQIILDNKIVDRFKVVNNQ